MNNKSRTLKQLFNHFGIIAVVAFLLILVFSGVFIPLYHFTEDSLYFYLGIGTLSLTAILYFVAFVVYLKKLYRMFYDDVFLVSDRNFARLKNHQKNLEYYKNNNIQELSVLNNNIKDVNHALDHDIVLSMDKGYSGVDLVYLDDKKKIVSYDSFHSHILDIVLASRAYRNLLILAYYELPDGASPLTDIEKGTLVDRVSSAFISYPYKLFSYTRENDGIYFYLPQIDSISFVKENLNALLPQVSLMRQDETGNLTSLPLHFALVCYPYSNIDELFSDLQFARRMGKLINDYFPRRSQNLSDAYQLEMHESMNLNNMTKLMSAFATLSISITNKKPFRQLSTDLKDLISYLNINEAGIFLLEDSSKTYHTLLSIGEKPVFRQGEPVPNDFIKTLEEIRDDDFSYFASRRDHLSSRLGELSDRLGISSCFYYLVYGDRGNLRAIIYFINTTNKEMILDTYLRESLLMIASKIGDYLLTIRRQGRLSQEAQITSSLLKLSQYAMYKINPKTYQLTDISEGILDATHQKINVGEYCYKALYDRESPCEKCPLSTHRKMKSYLAPWNIETSLTLNYDNTVDEQILLIKRLDEEHLIMDDPYDSNLLVNSYYTLIQSVKNAYHLNSHGYVLLLKIDNQMELVEKFGSEAVSQALRVFSEKVRGFETISNVYLYKPDTLAILLTEYGQSDVVNECEAIYDLSRTSFFEDKKTLFEITYLPVLYPQGYPTAIDFLRHSENFYSSGKYETHKNFIFFDESDYHRPASKNDFMLSVIDEKFTKEDFIVNLQPLLKTSNRKIFGAELLLRLTDEYRKIVFNTDELIKVAAANGKISLISSALLDYIDELYGQYGLTVFRVYGFDRLTINTDYSYLSDTTLSDKITELMEKRHLPKGFLGFEITEKEIYDHYDDMKKFMNRISSLGVRLICDRYSGEFLSFDRLKELGVSEFKIDRAYTRFIDTDKAKYTMVRSLLEEAKANNITVGLIGVENMEQYKIIHEINPDSYLQGYAFFKPLDKQALVEAIRKTNTAVRFNNR